MTSQTETTPLQPLQPVADEKNLLKTEDAAGSCCGGACCSS